MSKRELIDIAAELRGEIETLDKLYLEWSQFTKAHTGKERLMFATMHKILECASLDDARALARNTINSLREPNEMERLRPELEQAHLALDQALDCIRGAQMEWERVQSIPQDEW